MWCVMNMIQLFVFVVSGELLAQVGSNGKLYTGRYSIERKTKLTLLALNTMRPRQNGRHFVDDIVKCIF